VRKTQAQLIDYTNLKPGEVYRVHCPIGQVLARLLDKQALRFEITQGTLKSEARQKLWKKGDEFEAIPGTFKFYEVL
jgi:hypothetical protein